MDVLKALDTPARPSLKKGVTSASAPSTPKRSKKAILKPKPDVSEDVIRKKIEEKNNPPPAAVSALPKRSTSTMSDDIEDIQKRGEEAKRALAQKKQAADDLKQTEEVEGPERRNDVSKNDPNDPATVGKLKDILSKGAFKFSEKERAALSKILE